MTDDHPGMLPEGDRNRAGGGSVTEPVLPPHANPGRVLCAIRLILGPPALLAIAPLGTPPPVTEPPWVIIWAEDGRHWAGRRFTRRNDESAPPTLDPADIPAIQGDDHDR